MQEAVDRVLAQRERHGRAPRLARTGLVAALLLHGALAAAAVLVPRLGEEDRQPLEFVPVQLVPAQALGSPSPRPEPPTPAPPRPEPEPEPEEVAPAPEEPEPEPVVEAPPLPEPAPPKPPEKKPETKPEKKPETKPETRPQPPQSTPPRSDPGPSNPGAEAGGERGSPTGTPGGTSQAGARLAGIGDPSFTYGYYLDRILTLIDRQWNRPPVDTPLEVAITFRIERDGRVSDLDVERSSGFNSFDLAGLRAVQNASPLPPLPAGYRNDSLSIRLIIR